jgi:hypothetical protein
LKISLNVVTVLIALLASPAHAAFIGAYDFANWTTTAVNANLGVAEGASITTVGTNSVTMVSSDKGGGASNIDFTIKAAAAGLVSFNWNWTSVDSKNKPYKNDPFSFLVNGVIQKTLTDGVVTNGFYSFAVTSSDTFGFRLASTNSKFGAATTVISNFTGPVPAAVPLPASAWLMVAPLMALLRKRKVSTV